MCICKMYPSAYMMVCLIYFTFNINHPIKKFRRRALCAEHKSCPHISARCGIWRGATPTFAMLRLHIRFICFALKSCEKNVYVSIFSYSPYSFPSTIHPPCSVQNHHQRQWPKTSRAHMVAENSARNIYASVVPSDKNRS